MATLPPLGNPNYKLAEALKQLSAAKYGRPKAKVEAEIFARLATKPEPAPARAFGSSLNPFANNAPAPGAAPAFNAPLSPPSPPMPAPQSQLPPIPKPGSFLDDWLAKRGPARSSFGAPPHNRAWCNAPPPS